MTERTHEEHLGWGLRALCRGADAVIEDLAAADGIPHLDFHTGRYHVDPAYTGDSWEEFQWAGFLAGRLWLLHLLTRDERYRGAAHRIATTIAGPLARRPSVWASTGCDAFYALALGWEITGDAALRDAALAATRQLDNLWRPKAEAYFQTASGDRFVIDTALNLNSCYWAERHVRGASEKVVAHNRSVLRYGLVREDGSAYQAVNFDLATLTPLRRYTVQGAADETTWARAQGWGIHNCTNAWEATRDPAFLDAATRMIDWYLAHVPEDRVPFYDFQDPDIPNVPRDSCTATLVTNAMIRLARWRPELASRYRPAIEATLTELLSSYLTAGGILLHGSWGRKRAKEIPGKPGAILKLGRYPQEDIMPYGNYWIAECVFRERAADWSVLSLAPGSR